MNLWRDFWWHISRIAGSITMWLVGGFVWLVIGIVWGAVALWRTRKADDLDYIIFVPFAALLGIISIPVLYGVAEAVAYWIGRV